MRVEGSELVVRSCFFRNRTARSTLSSPSALRSLGRREAQVLRNGEERLRRASALLGKHGEGAPLFGVVDLQGTVTRVQLL